MKPPAKPRYSRCAGCEAEGGGPKGGVAVIMFTGDGWEHLDALGRPAGVWRLRDGPPARHGGEGSRIGHMARPIITGIGEVIWTDAAGARLGKRKGREGRDG